MEIEMVTLGEVPCRIRKIVWPEDVVAGLYRPSAIGRTVGEGGSSCRQPRKPDPNSVGKPVSRARKGDGARKCDGRKGDGGRTDS